MQKRKLNKQENWMIEHMGGWECKTWRGQACLMEHTFLTHRYHCKFIIEHILPFIFKIS